ncbi:MAG TPA: DUF4394 domain-containing protein, partial [Pyrinomonadaceae bacterium]|nr:DUF4394 domain-containing protein [Pyrinomonadaceae bacterium]
MKFILRLVAVSSFSITALLFCTSPALAQARVTFYGVTTGNQLVRFASASPGAVTSIGSISGLQQGENVLGIDFRPVNGQL